MSTNHRRTRSPLARPTLACEWRAYNYALLVRRYHQPRTATSHSKVVA